MSKLVMKKRINNVQVKAVPVQKAKDTRPILGADLFPKLSCNIFYCAKKLQGKTSAIYETVKSCANKETKVIAFCGTLHNDPSWITIQKHCEQKHIEFEGHTSIFDDDGDNILEAFINRLKSLKEGKEEEEGEDDRMVEEQQRFGVSGGFSIFGSLKPPEEEEEEKKQKKKKKSKFQSPQFMVILDDVPSELKNKSVTALMKIHRHFSSKILLSSQSCNDLAPAARNQVDYCLLYGSMPVVKIENIWENMALPISFEQLYTMYEEATAKKYNFLYIDTQNTYRCNFNEELEIPPERNKEGAPVRKCGLVKQHLKRR